LKVKEIKLESKGIKSIKSRVTNISDYLETPMSTEEFKDFLFNEVYKNTQDARLYTLTDEDWVEIDRIMEAKFATWEWNYGNNPKFNIEREKKFLGGIVQACLEVSKGVIKNTKLYGDFFSEKDVSIVESALEGVSYNAESIREALKDINIDEYLKNITLENIIDVLI
jgi:lipoate-protein ligase A